MRLRRPKYVRYPVWTPASMILLGLLTLAASVPVVFIATDHSKIVEIELAAAVVAVVLFIFLAVGLYNGIRVRKRPVDFSAAGKGPSMDQIDPIGLEVPDLGIDGGDEGCLAALLGLALAVLALIAIVFIVWLLLSLLWPVIVVLVLGIYWVLSRALRQVFARSRQTRGNLALSLRFAALYTFIYTGWMFALLYAVHYFVLKRAAS